MLLFVLSAVMAVVGGIEIYNNFLSINIISVILLVLSGFLFAVGLHLKDEVSAETRNLDI